MIEIPADRGIIRPWIVCDVAVQNAAVQKAAVQRLLFKTLLFKGLLGAGLPLSVDSHPS